MGLTVAVAFVGCLFFASSAGGLMSAWQCYLSLGFVETPGQIVAHDVSGSRRNTLDRRENRRPVSKTKFLDIVYRYEVAGTTYENDRIQAGTFGMTSGANYAAFLERFPVGKDVSVFVDPEDPQRAVLVTGWSYVTTFLFGIGAFLGVVFWALHLLRKHWNTPQLPR